MAVPVHFRETKATQASRTAWTVWMLVALFGLYHVAYSDDPWFRWATGIPILPLSDIRNLAFLMSVIRTASQIWFGVYLCPYAIPFAFAMTIAGFNFLIDSLAIITALQNRTLFQPEYDYTVFAVFCLGIVLERLPEVQRAQFKAKSENKGKAHTSGLYSVVVHPNYLGYLVYRAAFLALGKVWQLQVLTAFTLLGFVFGDVQLQKQRNIDKYGDEFKLYWDTTPKLLPGIF
ncbi:hypothetical protein BASA81_006774 [Batrachochytrium salamandrivorans]|nr:hypothetical protein BASA81_006774 [Batrachochytrium salamandrivorans]